MDNLIQQLKDNEKPFGLMSEEMQVKANEIGCTEFDYYGTNVWESYPSGDFYNDQACRLRADYEDEPEIVECEIRCNDSVGKFYFDGLNMCPLSPVFNRPDFIGLNVDGRIFGCLYRNKKDPSMVHCMIKEDDLPLYDVISMVGGKVLFGRLK